MLGGGGGGGGAQMPPSIFETFFLYEDFEGTCFNSK